MDDLVRSAFQDELQKLGISPAVFQIGVPVALGTAFSGLALYDWIKQKKLNPHLTTEAILGTKGEQTPARKAIKQLLSEKPLIRPVIPVTTVGGVDKMLKDPKFNFIQRWGIKVLAKDMLEKGNNAAVLQGEERDYVIIPSKVNPRVAEHEIGHLQDFARRLHEEPGLLKGLLSTIWKPQYEKDIMERERRAWEYTQKTPLKEQALKSYERGFHYRRALLAAPAAAMMFLRGLSRLGGQA